MQDLPTSDIKTEMSVFSEKRVIPRELKNMPVMFSRAMQNPFCYFGASMVDCSSLGIGLESEYFVPPNSVVLVRTTEPHMIPPLSKDNGISALEVLWCRTKGQKGPKLFGFGGKLLSSERQQEVLKPCQLQFQGGGNCRWSQILNHLESENEEGDSTSDALVKAKEAAETRAMNLGIVNRFAAIISSTLEFNDILQTICKEMVEIFQTRNAGIGLLESQDRCLRIVAFHSSDPGERNAKGIRISLRNYIATRFVIETGQTIIVPDTQHNPLSNSYHDLAAERGTCCLMIVPLMTRNKVIGTIGLPATEEKPDFTPDEVLLGQTIASQISGAIENAKLYRETVIAKNLAEKELEIGRNIQKSFFPESLPIYPGWEFEAHFIPARQVSGDFYDVVPLQDSGKVCLLLGDVCDKGVGAALFMALFRSLIRAFVMQGSGCVLSSLHTTKADDHMLLLETIRSVNSYISEVHASSGMFATLFIGMLELKNGRLAYVNGGHEAPIIRSHRGVRCLLSPTGPAIGISSDITIHVKQDVLNHDEMLIAFTDGLADAQNSDGALYTRKRLISAIQEVPNSATGAISEVMREINRHTGETDYSDDVTILAVKRK